LYFFLTTPAKEYGHETSNLQRQVIPVGHVLQEEQQNNGEMCKSDIMGEAWAMGRTDRGWNAGRDKDFLSSPSVQTGSVGH
jgi:hypothetical protein